jgi:excisionase family DNA binding protein
MELDPLLSSAEAATLLGVSPATVKRWADEGLLPCTRTAGSHRRFAKSAVERFRVGHQGRTEPTRPAPDDLAAWLDLLLSAMLTQEIEARLFESRARLGSWWAVCDLLGPVIVELGRYWETGRITVLQEHLASELLARSLARVGEWLPTPPGAPRALLANTVGDEHTLGLSMAELCLRELGWVTSWAGPKMPTSELTAAVLAPQHRVRMLLLSASLSSTDRVALAAQAETLGDACETANTTLIFGGAGSWPDTPRVGVRLHDFAELHRRLRNWPSI